MFSSHKSPGPQPQLEYLAGWGQVEVVEHPGEPANHVGTEFFMQPDARLQVSRVRVLLGEQVIRVGKSGHWSVSRSQLFQLAV